MRAQRRGARRGQRHPDLVILEVECVSGSFSKLEETRGKAGSISSSGIWLEAFDERGTNAVGAYLYKMSEAKAVDLRL